MNLKYQLLREMKNLNYLIDHNIQNYFECIIKDHKKDSDNLPIKTYVNEIEK